MVSYDEEAARREKARLEENFSFENLGQSDDSSPGRLCSGVPQSLVRVVDHSSRAGGLTVAQVNQNQRVSTDQRLVSWD